MGVALGALVDTVKMKELWIPGLEVRSLTSGREHYSPLPLGLAKQWIVIQAGALSFSM